MPHFSPEAKRFPPPLAPPTRICARAVTTLGGASLPFLKPRGAPWAGPLGGRGQRSSVGSGPGLVGFGGGGGGSRERRDKAASRGPARGSGPGARWRPGRLRGYPRRCLATGRPPAARPRPRLASRARDPPGYFSARPRLDPRFHAVRVQNDAGKPVGVLRPGRGSQERAERGESAEPVELCASGLRGFASLGPRKGRGAALQLSAAALGRCPNFASWIETFGGACFEGQEPGNWEPCS